MADVESYSVTPASNTGEFPEGQAPSTVNDGGRQVQADVKQAHNRINGDITAGGTADALTATFSPAHTSHVAGRVLVITAASANATTTPTFTLDALAAKTITKNGGQALVAGDIYGAGHELILKDAGTYYELMNPATAPSAATATLATNANGILDSNGNEILISSATASAVNEVTIKNAATTANPTIQSSGEANTGLILADSNSNEVAILESTASAVNEITVTNAATGSGPDISATGDDTNIDINLTPKGTGRVKMPFKGALVYHSVDQSIANGTWTHLAFDTEDYDTNSIHDTVTNNQRLTVPTGVTRVRISGRVVFAADATGIRVAAISKNDETTTPAGAVGLPYVTRDPTGGSREVIELNSSVITVTGGDYFTLAVYQSSGASLDVDVLDSTYYVYFAMEIIE